MSLSKLTTHEYKKKLGHIEEKTLWTQFEGEKGEEEEGHDPMLIFLEEEEEIEETQETKGKTVDKRFLKVLKECYREVIKEELPPVAKISMGNTKLKKDGIASFSLVAGFNCPGAGACKSDGFCYAMKGNFVFKNVMKAGLRNYLAMKNDSFVEQIITQILLFKVTTLRLHPAGDFHDQRAVNLWAKITKRCPWVKFYAYTKSLHLDFSSLTKNKNFTLIQSEGGKSDFLINKSLPVAKIFESKDEMAREGFQDASDSDLIALSTMRVGLTPRKGTKAKFETSNLQKKI